MIDINSLIEVKLTNEENFLKVKETLTRIGIPSKQSNSLFQSCHILHKRGKYFIVHFKELFKLDGKRANISDEDLGRRNVIAKLLEEWGLVTIVNPEIMNKTVDMSKVKVVSFKEKINWELIPKYNIGRK